MKIATPMILAPLLAAAVCQLARPADAQFKDLASKVPSSANALVLIDVDKVMSSPAAVKEDWKNKHEKSYASGLTFLPPDSKAAILAAQFDFELMLPLWSVAAIELDHEPSLATIQRITGGTTDQIAQYSAVALAGDAYLVKFGPQLLAAMAPANRQAVGRWVRETESGPGLRLSPYLTEAYGFANDIGTPIILALDLQDVATAETIRETLEESDRVAKTDDIEELVKLLASIRGITLGITLQSEQPFGKVKVDFGQNVHISAEQAKSLLLHALSRRGAMLDELEEWTPNVSGKQVTLEGYLTQSGTKRLSSLFDRPPAFQTDAQIAGRQEPQSKEQFTVQTSQAYFGRVTDLIEDLRRKPKSSSSHTIAQIAVWCDSYARKIDQLPVLGVDPELAAYGAFAADSLRAASGAIKASNARKRIRQVNVPMQYNYYTYGANYGYTYRSGLYGSGYVPYGYSATAAVPDTRAYAQERTRVRAEERVTGANQAREIFQKLEEATGNIRRQMTMKHHVQF